MKEEIKVQILELVVILITISGLFLWSTSESRSETRRIEDLVSSMHEETYQEMKDFHGRLCTIEAKRKDEGK